MYRQTDTRTDEHMIQSLEAPDGPLIQAGVVLQTFPLADLPPERSATLQTFPQKICNIADLPPEDLQHCRSSPKGEGLQHCRSSPFHCRSSPREDLQHCRPSPIFVNFRILIFGCTEKHVLSVI